MLKTPSLPLKGKEAPSIKHRWRWTVPLWIFLTSVQVSLSILSDINSTESRHYALGQQNPRSKISFLEPSYPLCDRNQRILRFLEVDWGSLRFDENVWRISLDELFWRISFDDFFSRIYDFVFCFPGRQLKDKKPTVMNLSMVMETTMLQVMISKKFLSKKIHCNKSTLQLVKSMNKCK